eukprot:TRINITY_DN70178_c0_g1_i1.p1 TRINITY_DN70178_c0_g1~~TRINITY_DN70178_c0_g1_i1.p1  ORF type:complete len:409 (-),score=137.21 TRINITY_DN70178_c0_g1_i1:80-1306(-)
MATGGAGVSDLDYEEAEVQRAIALSLGPNLQVEGGMFSRVDDIENTQQVMDAIAIHKMEEQGNILKQFERSKPMKCSLGDPKANDDTPDNVVELSGVPWTAAEEQIQEFLKDCKIVKILIMLNAYRKSTGNAKVWLASKDDLEKALLCDKNYIGKRYVYVRKANKSTGVGTTSPSLHHGAFTVQLNELPWTATHEQICHFLFGCEVVGGKNGVQIEMNERGKSSGTAIVQLKTEIDVENALKFHKQKLGTRHVDVISLTTKAEEETKAKVEEEATTKVEEAATTIVDTQTTAKFEEENATIFGTETTAKAEEKPTSKERTIVKLSGVARKATVPAISDFLSGGNVKFIEIVRTGDSKGKPSGNAFIVLDSEDNLKAALSLNNTVMGNRKIEVCKVSEEEFEEEEKNII